MSGNRPADIPTSHERHRAVPGAIPVGAFSGEDNSYEEMPDSAHY